MTQKSVVFPEVLTEEKNWINHFDSVAAINNWGEEVKLKWQHSCGGRPKIGSVRSWSIRPTQHLQEDLRTTGTQSESLWT